MTNDTLIEFDYNKEALEKIRVEAESVDKTDKDAVNETVKGLVKIRGIIQKKGKSYRDDANAFNKKVLEKEKEYVSILQPLEEELKQVLADIKQAEIIEARREMLPMKRKQLELLKTIEQPTDEFILSLDSEAWVEFYNSQMDLDTKNVERIEREKEEEKERKRKEKEFKAKEKERAEKRAQEQAQKEIEETKRKAQEEIERAKREAEEKERQRLQKIEDEKKAKEDEERRVAEEKAKKEADEKYQKFLSDNDYNEETDVIIEDTIYRKVATFKK